MSSLINDNNVGPYFVDFAKDKWKAAQDYLDGQTSAVMNAA